MRGRLKVVLYWIAILILVPLLFWLMVQLFQTLKPLLTDQPAVSVTVQPTATPMPTATTQVVVIPGMAPTVTGIPAQPTATLKPATPANTAVASTVSTVCPTERQFAELVGVIADIDRTEPCAFHWRGDPLSISVKNPCPLGWICTLGISDKNIVYVGDNALSAVKIFAGTWRLVFQYPSGDTVYNKCQFLEKVQHEGSISDPVWTASAGNFICP